MASAYRSWTTRRRSLSVGVSSPLTGDHTVGSTWKVLTCSGRARWALAAVTAALDLRQHQRVGGERIDRNIGEAAGARPTAAAVSSSRTIRAVTYGRRSPMATAWAISGWARSRFSICAGEMFFPAEVMISSFLRSVIVR